MAAMSRIRSDRQRQFEAYFGPGIAANECDESLSTAAPLLSPSQTLQPRAVSFPSPSKGLASVMLGDSPSSSRSHFPNERSLPSSSYELFFSPSSHVSSLHFCSPSPVVPKHSTIQNTKSKSKHNNKTDIERFSVENITNCQSPGELQQTIARLQAQGRYPSLVRAAQKRLYQVQQASACPLINEEEEDNDMKVNISPKSVNTESLMYSYDEERDAASIVMASSMKHGPPLIETRSSTREQDMQREIRDLNQKIIELTETLHNDKLEFERQLQAIQRAKQDYSLTAQKLKQSLSASHQNTEQLTQNMEKLQEVNHLISMQLEAERSARQTTRQQAERREADLQNKIQELMQQINNLQASGTKVQELNKLLQCARMNFEIVKKERTSIMRTILASMGRDTVNVAQMTQNGRDSALQALVSQSKSSKSAVQAMQEALNVSEVERRKLSDSNRETKARLQSALSRQQHLEEENRALAHQVEQLSREIQEARRRGEDLLQQAREENQKEWYKREAMYKNTIRILQKEIRAAKSPVSHKEHRSVVQHAERLQSELEQMKQNSRSRSGNDSKNCQVLQAVPPSVKIGNTVIRPVFRTVNASSRIAAPASNKVSPPKAIENNDENDGKTMVPPPPPSDKAVAMKPKQILVENNLEVNKRVVVARSKLAAATSTRNGSEQLPVGSSLSKQSTPRLNFAFQGKSPSKYRAAVLRENGGLRGMQEKVRQLRSPTFKNAATKNE